ncbi:hypothetical protein FCV25MIE_20070 [Fagus crenata]
MTLAEIEFQLTISSTSPNNNNDDKEENGPEVPVSTRERNALKGVVMEIIHDRVAVLRWPRSLSATRSVTRSEASFVAAEATFELFNSLFLRSSPPHLHRESETHSDWVLPRLTNLAKAHRPRSGSPTSLICNFLARLTNLAHPGLRSEDLGNWDCLVFGEDEGLG